jgi:hypothetical protein
MSRQAFRVILREFSPHLVEDSVTVLPAGSIPTGTCENMRFCQRMDEDTLHPIHSLRERLNDKVPVLLAPSPHFLVRLNNRTNIIQDIFLLSSLVMEGHAESRQGLKSRLYVDLGSTRDTYMQVREAQADKIMDKIEDLFS